MPLAARGKRQYLALGIALVFLAASPRIVSLAQGPSVAWQEPVAIFDPADRANAFNPFIVVGAKGAPTILWEVVTRESPGDQPLVNALYCAQEADGYWSDPVDVIVAPGQGRVFWPQHAVDRTGILHVVWVGAGAVLHYSRAPVDLACDARAWETASVPLGEQVMYADVAVDAALVVHVAYAARGENVYYTRSGDDGGTWSAPTAVSSVSQTEASAFPEIAAGEAGDLHIVWEQDRLPDGVPGLGLYYAQSLDGGATWSEPDLFADGAHTQPSIIVLTDGSVHRLWNGRAGTRGRYHQSKPGARGGWSSVGAIMPKTLGGGQTGAVRSAEDSAGALHVVSGTDDSTYVALSRRLWTTPETIMECDVWGNLEHQNIEVGPKGALHVVANAGTRRVIYCRGQQSDSTLGPAVRISFDANRPSPAVSAQPASSAAPAATRAVAQPIDPWPARRQASAVPLFIGAAASASVMVAFLIAFRIVGRGRWR